MNERLAELALRRHLSAAIVVVLALVAVFLARASWAPPRDMIAGADAGEVERALTRQGIWTGLLLIAVPLLVARAARTVGQWRQGEIDWIASSPARAWTIVASTWAGGAIASALVVVATAFVAELAAGKSGPGSRLETRLTDKRAHAPRRDGNDARIEIELGRLDPPPASRLLAHVVLVAGAQASDVRVSARRANPDGSVQTSDATRRISGRAALEIVVPPGGGELSLAIEALDPAVLLALDESGVGLVVPVASERVGSFALAWRAWIASCAWIALALGAGAWVSGTTAALFALAITLPAWLGESSARWIPWPWSGLPDALELAGEGLVAPQLGWPALAGALAAVVIGIVLGAAGLTLLRRET